MSNFGDQWQDFRQSRSLKLTLSMLLLTMSVLFTADFFNLRGDESKGLREARKSVAESLAVQLSTLASVGDHDSIKFSVSTFVSRNPDVAAAALATSEGGTIAHFGDLPELESFSKNSTLNHMTVPIFHKNEPWGEVRVAFVANDKTWMEVRYFGFLLACCFLVYLLFLRKALAQLNPSQVVPGRVNSAFNMLSEGVVILDDQLRVLLANDAIANILDTTSDELVGQQFDDWDWARDEDWHAPWATALQSGLQVSSQPVGLKIAEDRNHLFMLSCAAVGNEQDGMRGVLVTLDDMTAVEQKNRDLAKTLRDLRRSQESISRKNKELEALATRDPLTGLANRRALLTNFEKEFAKATRESRSLSCVMVDIDHFKRINDTYGHASGDEVICAVANTLTDESREYDTVGRYGGEEFVLILPDLDTDAAYEISERLRLAIVRLAKDIRIPVDDLSASFGVAELEPSVRDPMDLLERADQALYAAKQGGRNLVFTYDSKVIKLNTGAADDDSIATPEDAASQDTMSRLVELESIVNERTRDLEMLREFDALTGIPKRALFLQRIETEIQRADRFEGKIGVLSMELKDLNRIVATFGHAAADALVVDVVSSVQDCLRRTDAVSEIAEDHSLSRITANEYGVLLADLDDVGHAMPVVTRLRRLFAEPFMVTGQKVYVGANLGVALYPDGGKTAVEILSSAGVARGKAALLPDKVSHNFASSQLDDASKEYVRIESDLYDAYDNNEFEVYYQPKFDLAKRQVKSLEALLRWHHPERGSISPVDFIPVAEANGLIHELSEFVLKQSIAQLNTWRAMGWDDLKMAVNISPVQLRSNSLVADVLNGLVEGGLPANQLELELTESSVIDSPQRARIVLAQLREAGVSISMDDFGTGYSSLSLLADLPLDTVKIDRSFVDAMGTSERSRAIVESVINMAHSLKLRVVGEGVETNEQLSLLASLGCNEIQGYLISRPLPADKVTEFLAQQMSRRQSSS